MDEITFAISQLVDETIKVKAVNVSLDEDFHIAFRS